MEVTWRLVTMIGARETALIRSRCPDCNPSHSTGWGGGWRNMDATRALWTSIAPSFGNLEGEEGWGVKTTPLVVCVQVFVHVCILHSGWVSKLVLFPDSPPGLGMRLHLDMPFFKGRSGSLMHARHCVIEKFCPTRVQSSCTIFGNHGNYVAR